MERKTISNETLERVKTLPRIGYDTYSELIRQSQVKRIVKLKSPKTIFFDEEKGCFLYLNPYHGDLFVCGIFNEEI